MLNHDSHWQYRGKIFGIDLENVTAMIRWETTRETKSVDIKDLQKYSISDKSSRKRKPKKFFSSTTRCKNFIIYAIRWVHVYRGWDPKGVDYMPLEWICKIWFYRWSSYVICFGLRQYLSFVPYIIEWIPKYLGWRGGSLFFRLMIFLILLDISPI